MWKETEKEKREIDGDPMTETMAIEQEYELVLDTPEGDADAAENPLLPSKANLVSALEYAGGAGLGFAIADLASAKIETMNVDYFTANPSVWWAIPITKFVAGSLLLWQCGKIRNPDMKRVLTGFSMGIYADVANDLIMAFGVDTSLGIERHVFVIQ